MDFLAHYEKKSEKLDSQFGHGFNIKFAPHEENKKNQNKKQKK